MIIKNLKKEIERYNYYSDIEIYKKLGCKTTYLKKSNIINNDL